MRCKCCDSLLTDYESSIKGELSNTYLDTCITCLKDLGIAYYGNPSNEVNSDGEICNTDELPELWE